MLSTKLSVFSTLRTRFRRRTTESTTDTLADALTALPRGFPLRVPLPTTRPEALQGKEGVSSVANQGGEIADLFKELKSKIAVRTTHDSSTVADVHDESINRGVPISSSSQPLTSSAEPSYGNAKDDVDVTSHMASLSIYPLNINVTKENISHFQVRNLRKLNILIKEADFPDFLFVHYTRISSKPVAYVRILPTLPKDAYSCVDPDILECGPRLCPRVAHLHVSDDEQITRPYRSSERNAVLSLSLGEEQSVYRSRVIAKLAPRMCDAHKTLRSTARFVSDTVSQYIATGRPLPVNYPIFYGMYLPYEFLTREMHTECEPGSLAGCREMSPIALVEDIELPMTTPPVWRAACMKNDAPVHMRSLALNAAAVSVV